MTDMGSNCHTNLSRVNPDASHLGNPPSGTGTASVSARDATGLARCAGTELRPHASNGAGPHGCTPWSSTAGPGRTASTQRPAARTPRKCTSSRPPSPCLAGEQGGRVRNGRWSPILLATGARLPRHGSEPGSVNQGVRCRSFFGSNYPHLPHDPPLMTPDPITIPIDDAVSLPTAPYNQNPADLYSRRHLEPIAGGGGLPGEEGDE